MADEKRKRLNLEMTPPVEEALNALKQQTGASSNVEVIRRALAIYRHLAEEVGQQRRILTRPAEGTDGTEREIVFF